MLKILLLNYGCAVNRAEGEAMAGVLASRGFSLVNSEEEADIVVVNTCGVKTPTEDKILHRLKTLGNGKRIIVTGCLPRIIGASKILSVRSVEGILGPAAGEEIVNAVQSVFRGERYFKISGGNFSNLLPCLSDNPVIGKIVVSQGCLGGCSYCATRFARGRLKSYDIEEIVSAISKRVAEGAREIWLSSQDNSVYGVDRDGSIVELLEKVSKVNGNFLVRIGMMNPSGVIRHLDRLAEIIRSEKFFKFIHIPLQSGSNRVLKDMNRGYTVEEFIEVISRLRETDPNITVETDVIAGYPTEEEEDFEETLRTIEKVKPDFMNISKFYPRPGTYASRLPRLPTEVVSRRSRILTRLSIGIREERNRSWIGWEGVALVDEKGTVPGSLIARNAYYRPIVLKQPVKLGSFVLVRAVSCKPNFLLGEILEDNLSEDEALRLLRS
ncbi:MAG: tRNA (N(6)-L-threonylcarbamoyladenosine(37)-C(2))-methylthiotransferase [Thermoproteota archaeon]